MHLAKYKSDDQSQLFQIEIRDKHNNLLGAEVRRFPKSINSMGEEVFEFSLGDQQFPGTPLKQLIAMNYQKIDESDFLGLCTKDEMDMMAVLKDGEMLKSWEVLEAARNISFI